MFNKRILIISAVIYPRISPRAIRATELAKEFARKGYDVTIYGVLGKYDYSDFEKTYNVRVKNLGKTRFFPFNSDNDNIEFSLKYRVLNKLFKKSLDYPNIELAFWTNRVLKREKNVDLLITVAMPFSIHWGAAYRKTRNKNLFPKLWVADCGDPYMGNSLNKPVFYFKYVEKWFCRAANFISIPLENAKKAYYEEFHQKIKIIPQGFDLSQTIEDIDDIHIKEGTLTFVYAGTFYTGVRDPRSFLEYLTTRKDIDFQFLIFTKSKEILEEFNQKLGDKMIVRDFVPREELLSIMKKVDFLVNFENNTEVQSPSKLIDYAIVDKPILSMNSSEELDKAIINEFLNRKYSNSLRINDIYKYDIKNVANQFIELMDAS